MNENEMNFQYIEYLDVEILNSNFTFKEPVLSLSESSTEKSSAYEEKVLEINTSSEGSSLVEVFKKIKVRKLS